MIPCPDCGGPLAGGEHTADRGVYRAQCDECGRKFRVYFGVDSRIKIETETCAGTDISGPRSVSASFDMKLTPEGIAAARRMEQDRIRAEVEAMGWPEVIGE